MDELIKLLQESVNKATNGDSIKESFLANMEAELNTISSPEEAKDAVRDIATKAIEGLVSQEVKLDLNEEDLKAAIDAATPNKIPLPEGLKSIFENIEDIKEEEIDLILKAVESDKINRSVADMNEKIRTAGLVGELDAEKLAEIKEFVHPAIYSKMVEGDSEALGKLVDLLPKTKPADELTPEEDRNQVLAGFAAEPEKPKLESVSPEAIQKEREAEFNAAIEEYKSDLVSKGISETEIADKVKVREGLLLNELKQNLR